MKTHSHVLGLLVILAAAPLAFAAPAQCGPATGANPAAACVGTATCPATAQCASQGNNKAAVAACGAVCTAAPDTTTSLTLSAEASAVLLFQIDEERMARELYTAFGAKWSLRPFANIPPSEARHEAVLRQLATRAGLALPTAVAGQFDSAEVQSRYNALLALGNESADAALRVGAYVEEVDIADLNTLIASTDSAELKTSATALKTASGHHLSAFVGGLSARGITYAPQVLTADDFKTITGTAEGAGRGRGRGGRGPGRA
jgi:hypothetical protein